MKRLCALILCITMLSAGFVFAEAAETYNYTVDFDSLPIGSVSESTVKSTLSSIFSSWETNFNGNDIEIVEDGNGGSALKITSQGAASKHTIFKSIYLPDTIDETGYMTFRFKVDDSANKAASYAFSLISDSVLNINQALYDPYDFKVFPTSGASTICNIGEWYSVQIKFTRTASATRADVTIITPDGTAFTGYRNASTGRKMIYFDDKSGSAGQSIVFDDFRMFTVSGDEEVTTEPITVPDSADNMSRVPSMKFTYNPLLNLDATSIMVNILDKEGNALDESMYDYKVGFDSIKVEVKELLEKGEDYSVVISGITAPDGTPAEDYTFNFTTEVSHVLTLADKVVTVDGDTTKVDLSFEGTMGYPETKVKLITTLYSEGKRVFFDYQTAVIDADGKLYLEYQLPEYDEEDDFTISVFDDLKAFIPVCEPIK